MCTVTYIPVSGGFHLTSNRDENPRRSPALSPATYKHDCGKLIYPKDPQAGGTWITIKENGDAAVLLNGAFVNHQRQLLYRKSRGLIFLEIMDDQDPYRGFAEIDLEGIEPFTMIRIREGNLQEYRWDGALKHVRSLDNKKSHIWSSATLYDEDAAAKRRQWFGHWQATINEFNMENVLLFHEHTGKDDPHNALVMKRGDHIRTVSITSVSSLNGATNLLYRDLRTGRSDLHTLVQAPPSIRNRLTMGVYNFFRETRIKLFNWEYWPSYLIYGPVFFYWCWLSLKARSFFFFSAANPGILHAGFVQEKKSEIYKIMPPQYYPRTRLYKPDQHIARLLRELKKEDLAFPLIAKPDIGQKGILVKLLHDEKQLRQYNDQSKVDFLVQEYVGYEMEAGIFYYRIPGESKGQISGIVGKEFLQISGDGSSTIETLLNKTDRHFLQLENLRGTNPDLLHKILPAGEQTILVPYGNHSRGAKFIDLSNKITEELTRTIDNICQQIPGFYYGRLDIRFRSWEDLSLGKHFSVIEVNGAGSEPTHMYDHSHSILFAWKEICRHWRLMYIISKANVKRGGARLMTTSQGFGMIREYFAYQRKLK